MKILTIIFIVAAISFLTFFVGVEPYYIETRLEKGEVIDSIKADTIAIRNFQHGEPSMKVVSVEVGKKIKVGDIIAKIPNKSSSSVASRSKIGDCVKIRVKVYSTATFRFLHSEKWETIKPQTDQDLEKCD